MMTKFFFLCVVNGYAIAAALAFLGIVLLYVNMAGTGLSIILISVVIAILRVLFNDINFQ